MYCMYAQETRRERRERREESEIVPISYCLLTNLLLLLNIPTSYLLHYAEGNMEDGLTEVVGAWKRIETQEMC